MASIKFFFQLSRLVLDTMWTSFRVTRIMKKEGVAGYYDHARKWSARILKNAGVTLEAVGAEKIDPNEQYIFVSNHTSMFDIPVLLVTLPGAMRIVYKKELEKIPFFGKCLQVSPYISIDRTDPRDAMATIEAAAMGLKDGGSVIVFAEGTRSLDGKLQPFKRGAFMLATKSGMPIVPVAVTGSGEIMRKGEMRIRGGKIKVEYGDVIRPEYPLSRPAEKALMAEVWGEIAKKLEK